MIITPPPSLIARWRRDALAAVLNPASRPSLREWAWKFLRQWGVA